MKFLSFVLLLVLSLPVFAQEESNWYAFGGLSIQSEDTETLVGDGLSFLVGVGFQFNKSVGLEFRVDNAPTIEPDSLVDAFEDELNITLISYEIETTPNVYSSILGTLTFPMNETRSVILKAGYTTYSVETEFVIDYAESDRFFYRNIDLSFTDEGSDPIISAGLQFFTGKDKKRSWEISATKIFGDAGLLSINGLFRFNF